jgi:hypothetical protein
MGVVIGIIMVLESRAARAPSQAAKWASAWLTMLTVFGFIPILLSNDTGVSYDGEAAREKVNPPRQISGCKSNYRPSVVSLPTPPSMFAFRFRPGSATKAV